MLAKSVLVRATFQIGPDFRLFGEMMRPVMVGFEREREEMVRRIHGAAGINVLVPGAADRLVLFDDAERDAGFLELDRHTHAGQAGADDQYVMIGQRLGGRLPAPFHRAWIGFGQIGFFQNQRNIFVRHRLAHHGVHHPPQQIVGWPYGGGTVGGRIFLQHRYQPVADARLQLRRDLLHEVPGAVNMRGHLVQQRRIRFAQMHQYHQQGLDIGLF